jgi:hypothetical protein
MKYNIKVCYPAFSGRTIFFGQRDFEYDVEAEAMSHRALLERVFAAWNCGSGQESDVFLASNQRSLSVGDFVAIDGSWYRCEPMGWREALKSWSDD